MRNSKKDREHNGQKQNNKRKNNVLQNITHKTKDRATRTPLKIGGERRYSERVSSSCSTSDTL
jgi:hypothetical protein